MGSEERSLLGTLGVTTPHSPVCTYVGSEESLAVKQNQLLERRTDECECMKRQQGEPGQLNLVEPY